MSGEYTRNKVLKRAAVGAAAVWSVPLFASAASASTRHAAAGSVSKCVTTDANGRAVPSCTTQSFAVCGTPSGTSCFCFPGAKAGAKSSGCCVCGGNVLCSNSTVCSAHGNADCPSGWKCTFNACGQTCVPPCGQGIALVAGAGKTAAGV